MIERESILSHIQTILKTVPGVTLVTRADMRAIIPSLPEFPAICIVDGGDQMVERDSREGITWWMTVGIVSVVKGTSESSTPSDCTTFESQVKVVLHKKIWDCKYVLDFEPESISELKWPQVSPRIVAQGQAFRIKYFENVYALINPTE